MTSARVPVIIIGAGQAGLTLGYRLREAGVPFLILEGRDRVGDVWRARWASLRLFSLPRFAALPGRPLSGRVCSTGGEYADYLEAYAAHFDLPVRTGVRVERITRGVDGFLVEADSEVLRADQVVVATGAYQVASVPALAGRIDPAVTQLHSVDYRGPGQLRGDVLVVGAGNSGTDIALEAAAAGHPTWLAGRHPGQLPVRIDSPVAAFCYPVFMLLARWVQRLDRPWGPRAREQQRRRGTPLVRNGPRELRAAGIERIGRVDTVVDGRPVTADGVVPPVDTVVWCTGFRPDFGWTGAPLDSYGEPVHRRGVIGAVPGLYVIGLEFLYSAASATIQGVDQDARHLAAEIGSRVDRPGSVMS